MEDFGDFGDPGVAHDIAGPLVGGGLTQVGMLATRMLSKTSPRMHKWAPTVGFALGSIVSAILAFRASTRSIGIAGLITSALIAIPRQVEELMGPGTMQGYLGVITPEQQMQGDLADEQQYGDEQQNGPVELLDGGGGLGIQTAEQMQGAGDVEIMGSGAFGSNFLS